MFGVYWLFVLVSLVLTFKGSILFPVDMIIRGFFAIGRDGLLVG